MTRMVKCPACGTIGIDLCKYKSMMVLRKDVAMFTLRCPHCSETVSMVCTIPDALYDEVSFAAIEVDAGMGREV